MFPPRVRADGVQDRALRGPTAPERDAGSTPPAILEEDAGSYRSASVLDRSIEEIFWEYPNPKDTLVKFILPADKVREKGMRELYRMNITQATLFPDLPA